MISNYLKLSFRNLLKSPLFTALNVMGLALGLAVSILLFLFVHHEKSFDQFHTQHKHIYRTILNASWDGAPVELLANAPNALAPALKENIPAVEQSARLLRHEFGVSAFVNLGDKKLVEEKLYWTDPALFDIFDFQTVAGDLKSALTQPNTVALSRSAAVRYFGSSNVVGQSIVIDRMPPMQVRAVYEDLPANSTLDADVLGAISSIKWAGQNLSWGNASFETWVLLNKDADRPGVEKQIAGIISSKVPLERRWFSVWLQPLNDVHLYSSAMRNNYSERLGDPKQVNILAALALAVLMIACFNYMNLSTARSQLRFREVGINKTMGATRSQLAVRFYSETVLLVGASLLIALFLTALGIRPFNDLADKALTIRTLLSAQNIAVIVGGGALLALVAGSYPALMLSSFSPKNLLNTVFRKDTRAGWVRRSLVTVQFAASISLIIGTIVLYRQMKYIQQKKLGYEAEQVVALTTTAAESTAQLDGLIQECKNLAPVREICRAQTFPAGRPSGRTLQKNLSEEGGKGLDLSTNRVTPGFEKVLQLKLLAGTGLPVKSPDDTLVHVVLNKTAVDYLGFTPEEAIGKRVECDLGPNAYIAGVVADFHAESLHKAIGAYAFHDAPTETRRYLLVKLQTENLPETMARLENVFKSALPQSAFEYKFLDDHLQSLYQSERRTAKTVLIFSVLSIFVSCLGLFGLVAFAAEQRTREIGIRRVLGATVAGITNLLAKDFIRLVLLAVLIATPASWWLLNRWLSDFAYRIELQWWMVGAAGVFAALIAFFTVSIQGVKAALANPVKSLRQD